MGYGTESLSSQVQALLSGALVVPSIQRGYVWQRSQVPGLLDSLYRGFPVGSLLVWKTTQEIPLRPAAVLQKEHAYAHPAVLLDGQQRLTSIAKVMSPESIVGPALDVRFDLRDETFLNPSAVQRRNSRFVSVSDLLGDSPQFGELVRSALGSSDDPDFDTAYSRLRKVHAIRDYSMPVITVESEDYEEVAEIFARVNQGGRRLSKGDLVFSAIASRWPDGLDQVETFRKELADGGFDLDREAILRLMGLVAGSNSRVIRLIGKDMTGDRLKSAWRSTEEALRRGIDFLRGECGIPRAYVLTSPNAAVIPSFLLFRRSGQLDDVEARALRRWVYMTMAFSHYSNQVESKLDTEARLCGERTGDALFDDLIRRASGLRTAGTPLTANDLVGRGASSPLFNLLYIVALQQRARDWRSNTLIIDQPLTATSRIEYHHVFPKARVLERYGKDLTNSLANLAFISGSTNRLISAKLPEDYLATIPTERLVEQNVPTDAALWTLDAFPQFLAARRQLMAGELNQLLGLRGDFSEPTFSGEPVDDSTDDDVADFDDPLGPATGEASSATVSHPYAFRRNVSQHVREVFDDLTIGEILTISQIVAAKTSQYSANEVSAGAVRNCITDKRVHGVLPRPDLIPFSAEKIAPTS